MKQFFLSIVCLVMLNSMMAQNTDCAVGLDSLKGTYTGDCKNGKANGNGKAVGIHTYDGEFKNGLPEGKGKYTWSNGNYYYGSWKKGQKDGKGQLHQFENGTERLITGYWKKDNYKGEYENPYVIANVTNDIGRVEVRKMNDKESTVSVTVESRSNTFGSAPGTLQSITIMSNHQVVRGSYVSKANNALTNKEITTFKGVIFPFRCVFNFGTSMVEIEFFEQGAYDVVVPINK